MSLRDNDDHDDEHRGPDGSSGASESGSDESTASAPPTVNPDHVRRVVEAVRRLGQKVTIDKVQDEVNTGDAERLSLGQVDVQLREALRQGLLERQGEEWTAVPAGALAMRRAELLQELAVYGIGDQDWADAERAFTGNVSKNPVHESDMAALVAAGLARAPSADEDFYSIPKELARALVGRGAVQAISEKLPECRVVSSSAVTIVLAPEAADEQTKAAIAIVAKERDDAIVAKEKAEQALSESTIRRARLRAYLEAHGVNTQAIEEPAPAPSSPKPAEAKPVPEGARKAEWTKEIVIDEAEKARIADEYRRNGRLLSELRREQSAAKEQNSARMAAIKERLNAAIDTNERLDRELEAGKRTVTREAIVTVDWHTHEEIWTDAETGTELERKKVSAGPIFDRAQPSSASPPPAGESPIAPAEESSKGAPAAPAPPALTKESVLAGLVALVGELGADETISTVEATARLAKSWGIEADEKLGKWVKVGARAAHGEGLIHWEAKDGAEWIGRPRGTKKEKAAKHDPETAILAALADGPLSKAELMGKAKLTADTLAKALKSLIDAGKVSTIGKAKGTKYKLGAAEEGSES